MANKWIEHQGKKILHNDYRGTKTEQGMLQILADTSTILTASPTKVLMLTDFTGTSVSPEYMNQVKKLGKEVMNFKVEKGAVLGITGLKKILMDSFLAFTGATYMKTFDSEAEAFKWLCE
jgi:hypothetical protein